VTSRRSTDLALIAAFAALTAVCALLPALQVAGPVPLTLQTFGVLLTGAVLGPRRGFWAIVLYLAVGAAGLPVFAGGKAGLAVFAGPTVGYLLSFPVMALLAGALLAALPGRRISATVPALVAACLVAVAVNHAAGIAGMVWRADLTWAQAVDADLVFWPGDLLKAGAASVVATAVHRAFPGLVRRRPAAVAAS